MFYLFTFVLFAEQKYTNALIKENSPYLQQHAHNPVNWYPWGKEAFEKAKKENKLIFLSIGYSTCHWCHVMEEESFENKAIAKLLNDNYIAIKVDREAYPQLDKKYQNWYQSVYGKRGGWPLSVFLSPEGNVFHLATYIPAEEGYGSKGMFKMLPSFVSLYHKHRNNFDRLVKKYEEDRFSRHKSKALGTQKSDALVSLFMQKVKSQFDPVNGGFAKRPKFPEASKIELLLDIYRLKGNKEALKMGEFTLRKMAEGGIYDQIGGGFFRYTTDVQWDIPHFEKMLYTNAELISVYSKAYRLTQKALYKKVVAESISRMEAVFMKNGLFFSASDADSAGEEGGYFIYSYMEVKEALLKRGMTGKETEEVLAYLGIEEDGNIDGELSHVHIANQKVPKKLKEVKAYLQNLRTKRPFPFVDKKIITSWNAMMVKALFSASSIDKKYETTAKSRLQSLLNRMQRSGILYHQTLFGEVPEQKALLEDYAFLMDALISAYEHSYDFDYLKRLNVLAREALRHFYRKDIWYLSDDGIDAYADFDDKYYTASLSLMLEDLLRLSLLSEKTDLREIVKSTLQKQGAILEKDPQKASKLLHTFLRLQQGDVLIGAERDRLLQAKDEIDAIRYPFILTKVEEGDTYLACRINSCFAYDKNITTLIKKIEKAVK